MRVPLLVASFVLLAGGAAGCAGPLTSSSGSPTSVPLSVARPGHLFKEMYYLTVDHHGDVYADDTISAWPWMHRDIFMPHSFTRASS